MGLFDFLRDLFNPVKGPKSGPPKGAGASPKKAAPAPAGRKPAPPPAPRPARPRPAPSGPPPGLPALPSAAALAAAMRIPEQDVGWLCDQKRSHYTHLKIPKASGGVRGLEAPKRRLKAAQRWILRNILDRIPAAEPAHGFVKGRSPITNARAHVGRSLVARFDLRDFFWTIKARRVAGLFRWMGYPRDVAWALTRLCCSAGRLPQGAPTSPAITTIVCRSLDRRLAGLARVTGSTYTRYADDLTFSFGAGRGIGRKFMRILRCVLRSEGLALAPEKTRFARRGSRQSVTGLTVNSKVSPPRDEVRALRALLHEAKAKGAAAANRNGEKNFAARVRGRIEAVRAADAAKGEKLLARWREVGWSG